MKYLITILLLLFTLSISAQKLKLIHINAKWNTSNNYQHLRGIKNVKIQMVYLEDQPVSLKTQIKSVPFIILLDEKGKPRGQWQADLTFKLNVPQEEIQEWINRVLMN
tara:strand:- start:3573 stop:3896 length:324 start_codon:yes stop_codon:yes gene_type:complete